MISQEVLSASEISGFESLTKNFSPLGDEERLLQKNIVIGMNVAVKRVELTGLEIVHELVDYICTNTTVEADYKVLGALFEMGNNIYSVIYSKEIGWRICSLYPNEVLYTQDENDDTTGMEKTNNGLGYLRPFTLGTTPIKLAVLSLMFASTNPRLNHFTNLEKDDLFNNAIESLRSIENLD